MQMTNNINNHHQHSDHNRITTSMHNNKNNTNYNNKENNNDFVLSRVNEDTSIIDPDSVGPEEERERG